MKTGRKLEAETVSLVPTKLKPCFFYKKVGSGGFSGGKFVHHENWGNDSNLTSIIYIIYIIFVKGVVKKPPARLVGGGNSWDRVVFFAC